MVDRLLETRQIWKFIESRMKDSSDKQLLEIRQIWKLKFANHKPRMEKK